MDIQVVILAGGESKRLRPLTDWIPKCMIEFAGKPFIDHQISLLYSYGFRKFLILGGYRYEVLKEHFHGIETRSSYPAEWVSNEWPEIDLSLMNTSTSSDQRGTGGSLYKAKNLLDKTFLLLYGDVYLKTDYNELIGKFKRSRFLSLMAVDKGYPRYVTITYSPNISEYRRDSEFGEGNWSDAGAVVMDKSCLDLYSTNTKKFDLEDTLYPYLASVGLLAAYRVDTDPLFEIGTMAGMERFKRFIGNEK